LELADLRPGSGKGKFAVMDWQFKFGLGFTVVFGLLAFAVKDMPHWVTWPGIVVGCLLILWGIPPFHDRVPIGRGLLFIVVAAVIGTGVSWYLDMSADIRRGPNISFQRYALFWVRLEPDVYQLKAVIKLFNTDNTPYLVSVNFNNISFVPFPRGSMIIQQGFVQIRRNAQIEGDNYIEAGRPGYYPVEIPIKLYAHVAGDMPVVFTFGQWRLQIGDQNVGIEPRQTSTYRNAVTPQEWDEIKRPNSKFVDALDYQKMPGAPGTGPDQDYLVGPEQGVL
jgi:hypothetical protein